jgi:teichuronic acid biosynthesis glycosyltransferase TuaG
MNKLINVNEKLVSIIMPAYNSEEYIKHAIESVESQTYDNWELIIVDDHSNDETYNIIQEKCSLNHKIKCYRFEKNKGAAMARNKAVEMSNGDYIAFLDSDDIWEVNKLSEQIEFMSSNNYNFSCTSYKKVDQNGIFTNQIIKPYGISDYKKLLKNCPGNSTVIYNSQNLGKHYIPDVRKRNDYLMWILIIKKAKYLYGFDSVLSSHRVRLGSLSSNKRKLIHHHWHIYRDIEKLSLVYSTYLIIYWLLKKLIKR